MSFGYLSWHQGCPH